ncbi:MAG: tetratricopeptide repeat protein [Anaerolineales bacterium]
MNKPEEYLRRVNAALALRDVPDYQAALFQLQHALELAPQDPAVHLLIGLTYQDINQFENAERSYRQSLVLEPSFKDAQQSLGLLLAKLNKNQDAIKILLPLFQLEPKNISVCKALALAFRRVNKTDLAIETLRTTFDLVPDEDISIQLAMTYAETENIEEAIKVLLKAIESKPTAELYSRIARIYLEEDDPKAPAYFRQALELDEQLDSAWVGLFRYYFQKGELTNAFDTAERGLAKNPQSKWLLQAKAEVLFSKGKKEDCIQTYGTAIDISRNSGDINDLAFLMYLRDKKLLKGFGPRKALSQIDKDLRETSNFPLLILLKIEILFERKHYGQIIQILENTDYLSDDNFAPIYYRALHGMGKLEEASTMLLQKLGKLEGDDRIDFLERIETVGVEAYQKGEIDISKHIFEQLLQIDPERARPLNNLAFMFICERQWDQALELLSKAQQNDYPNVGILLTNRGYIYLCQKLYDLSIQTLQSAIHESSKEDEAILHIAFPWNRDIFQNKLDDYPSRLISVITAIQANLATAFYMNGDIEKAITAAQAAIENTPRDCIGYRSLGCLYYAQGNVELTRQMWKKALRLDKTKEESKTIKNWLNELPEEKKIG